MVVFCKNNHAKNKILFVSRPVELGRYLIYIPYKVGFTQKGWVDLLLWNFEWKGHIMQD
jgi:hypothetical protein